MHPASHLAGVAALLGSLHRAAAQVTANPAAVADGDLIVYTAAESTSCTQTPMAWTWSGPADSADSLTVSIGVQPITANTVASRSLGDRLRMVHRRAGSSPPVVRRAVQVYTKVAGAVPITQNMFRWNANVLPGTYRYVVSVEGAGVVSFSDSFKVVAGPDMSCVSGGNALSSSSSVTDATSTAAIPAASSTLASIPRDPTTSAAPTTSSSIASSSLSSSSATSIPPTSALPASPLPSATSGSSDAANSSTSKSDSNSGAIAAGVVVPLVALAALILFCLYRRRRRAHAESSSWDEKYGPGGRARASQGRMTAVDVGSAGAHMHARSLSGPVSIDGIKMAESHEYYTVGFDGSESGHHTMVVGPPHPNGAAPPYSSPVVDSDAGDRAEVLRNSSSGSAGSRYRRLLLPSAIEARDEAARKLALTSRFSDTTAATTAAGGNDSIVSPVSPATGLVRSFSTSSAMKPGASRNGAAAQPLNRSLSSGSTTNIRRKPVKYSLSFIEGGAPAMPAVPAKEEGREEDAYDGIDGSEDDFEIPIKATSPPEEGEESPQLQLPSPAGEEMGASNRSSKDPYSPTPDWPGEFDKVQSSPNDQPRPLPATPQPQTARDDSASPFSDAHSVSLPTNDAPVIVTHDASSPTSPNLLENLEFPRPAFLNGGAAAGPRSSATSVSLPYIGEGGVVRPPSHAGSERFPRSVRSGVDSLVGAFPLPALPAGASSLSRESPVPGRSSPAPEATNPSRPFSDGAAEASDEGKYKLELNMDKGGFRLSF